MEKTKHILPDEFYNPIKVKKFQKVSRDEIYEAIISGRRD
jgi:hypothetical protein